MNIKNTNIKSKGLVPLFFLLAFFSCKKESSEIGVGLRDDGGGIGSVTKTFTNVICNTEQDDSIRTSSLPANLLGIINDPVFGESKANLVIQPRLTEVGVEIDDAATVDSVILDLEFARQQLVGLLAHRLFYGDLESEISLDIYRLESVLEGTDSFYSNYTPTLGDKVGSFQGKFLFDDDVTQINDGDTAILSPRVSINLDNSFGQDVLDFGDAAYGTVEAFLDALKGLVIVPTSVVTGEGVIVGINTRGSVSSLKLFYSDTLTLNLPLQENSKRINYYETTQPSSITSQFSSNAHFSETYSQSMAGAKVRIEVPGLKEIIESPDRLAINEAKIELLLADNTVSDAYGAPSRMWLQASDSDGVSVPIVDLIDELLPPSTWVGLTNYGGDFNATLNGYEFHFNRYLQGLKQEYEETGINNFKGFFLSVPGNFPVVPSRGVFKTDTAAKDVKVSVTYSKLN